MVREQIEWKMSRFKLRALEPLDGFTELAQINFKCLSIW